MIRVKLKPRQTAKTVLMALSPDAQAEGPESFTVELWFEFGAPVDMRPGRS